MIGDLKFEYAKEEEEKRKGLPDTHWKHKDPEGVIARLEKENEMLRRLCMDKILKEMERELYE